MMKSARVLLRVRRPMNPAVAASPHVDLCAVPRTFAETLASLLRTLPLARSGATMPSSGPIRLGIDWYASPKSDLCRLADAVHAAGLHARHIFVRSTIGSGKSSLLELAAHGLSLHGIKIFTVCPRAPFYDGPESIDIENGATVRMWTNGVAAPFEASSVADFRDAVVFIDECHLALSSLATVTMLIKDAHPSYVFLLSTTKAFHYRHFEGAIGSPANITHKVWLELAFTHADVVELWHFAVRHHPKSSNQQDEYALFFVEQVYHLFAGHRLSTVAALTAVASSYDPVALENADDAPYRDGMARLIVFIKEQTVTATVESMSISPASFDTMHACANWCNVLLAEGRVLVDGAAAVASPTLQIPNQTLTDALWLGAMRPVIRPGEPEAWFEWSNPFVARWFAARPYALPPVGELRGHWSAVNVALCGLAYFDVEGFCLPVSPPLSEAALEAMRFGAMPHEQSMVNGVVGGLRSRTFQRTLGTSGSLAVHVQQQFLNGAWVAVTEPTREASCVDVRVQMSGATATSCLDVVVVGATPPDRKTWSKSVAAYASGNDAQLARRVGRFAVQNATYRQTVTAPDHDVAVLAFCHPSQLKQAKQDAMASVAAVASGALSVLVVNFVSALCFDVTVVRYDPTSKHTSQVDLGRVDANLCPCRINAAGTGLERNQRFMTPLEMAKYTKQPHGRHIANAPLARFSERVLSNRDVPLDEALAQFGASQFEERMQASVWVQQRHANGEAGVMFAVTGAIDIQSLCDAIQTEQAVGLRGIDGSAISIVGHPDRLAPVDPAQHYTFEVPRRSG